MEGVRIQQTSQNFYHLMRPLYYFDAMLNGTNATSDTKITERDCSVLNELIDRKLINNESKHRLPRYIVDTFTAMTDLRTQIIINLHDINTNPQFVKIKKSIMNGSSEDANLIDGKIFKLFSNIDRLIIYSAIYDD